MAASTILSICIPSTYDRKVMTERLVMSLIFQLKQIRNPDVVEITTCYDNREMSIGAKRQKMIQEARGEYVVFIDSDDRVSDDYVFQLLGALESEPDCVGFEIKCTGTKGKTAAVSNRFNDWAEKVHGYDYVRTIYHKAVIRKSIVLQIGFKDMRYAEDYDFSKRLKDSGLLKSEVFIEKQLYFYMFRYQNPKIKYGF